MPRRLTIPEPLWTVPMVDALRKKDLKERLSYLDRHAVSLEQVANAVRQERREIMSRCCQSERHREWARLQDDLEHAGNETGLSVARRVLPARRIPWSEVPSWPDPDDQ
jgi:hypothetical protein